MQCTFKPIPPAFLDIIAQVFKVSYMPSMESSFMVTRKQDDIWGLGVPAAKRVGEACVKYLSDICEYVASVIGMQNKWNHIWPYQIVRFDGLCHILAVYSDRHSH